jgi:hypothetical protein
VIALTLVLTGCSILNMAKYNENEHMLVNRIRTVAEISVDECSNKTNMTNVSRSLYNDSVELYNFNSVTPYNDESINMSKSLVDVTKGLKDRYSSDDTVSAEYCKIKLRTIHDSAKAIQYSIVRKPR